MKNEQSFPIVLNGKVLEQGLTKREYFIAAAISGLASKNMYPFFDSGELVSRAFAIADKVMSRLDKENGAGAGHKSVNSK